MQISELVRFPRTSETSVYPNETTEQYYIKRQLKYQPGVSVNSAISIIRYNVKRWRWLTVQATCINMMRVENNISHFTLYSLQLRDFFLDNSVQGKCKMRLIWCELAPTREKKAKHNTGNYMPYSLQKVCPFLTSHVNHVTLRLKRQGQGPRFILLIQEDLNI